MAASIRNSLAGTIASLLLAALRATAGAAELVHPNPNDEFNWDAKVVTSDFRTDTLEISGDVRVTQGPMSIEAGAAKANGVRSQNSRWTFETAVHIVTSEAELQSNTASAAVVGGQLASARAEGSPAQFAQRGGRADAQVRGRAGVIEYDITAGIVKLTDNVWFSNGKDEFRGDVVIYNVRDERVQINPGGQGRVRGIIRPRQGTAATAPAPAPPQPPPQPESGA
ncbi:MAG TPA: LptA/OstA family protein [Steroidobacteraceae bacterium]|nr:LptA/OstA family protein [Steroidobacteraceae bacterium]